MIRTTGIINTPIGGMKDPNIYAINRDSMQMIDPAVGQSTAYQKTLLSYDPKMPVIKRGVDSRIRRNQVFGSKENRLGQIVSNLGVQDINFKDRKVVNQNDPTPNESKEFKDPMPKTPSIREKITKWVNKPLFKPDNEVLSIVTTSRGSGVSASSFIDSESSSSTPLPASSSSSEQSPSSSSNEKTPSSSFQPSSSSSSSGVTPTTKRPTDAPSGIGILVPNSPEVNRPDVFTFETAPVYNRPPPLIIPGTTNVVYNTSRVSPTITVDTTDAILNDPQVVDRIAEASSIYEQLRNELAQVNVRPAAVLTMINVLSEFLPSNYTLNVGNFGTIRLVYQATTSTASAFGSAAVQATQSAVLAALIGAGMYVTVPVLYDNLPSASTVRRGASQVGAAMSQGVSAATPLVGSIASTSGRVLSSAARNSASVLGSIATTASPYIGSAFSSASERVMGTDFATPHQAISFAVEFTVHDLRNRVNAMGSFRSYINEALTVMGRQATEIRERAARAQSSFTSIARSIAGTNNRRPINEFNSAPNVSSQPQPVQVPRRETPQVARVSRPLNRPASAPLNVNTRPQRQISQANYEETNSPPGEPKKGDYAFTKPKRGKRKSKPGN